MGLVALTVGCLALGAYMGRDLTGGAGLALSVGAAICLLGLNSARPTGAITHDHVSVRPWPTGSDRSPRATPARRAPRDTAPPPRTPARGREIPAPESRLQTLAGTVGPAQPRSAGRGVALGPGDVLL